MKSETSDELDWLKGFFVSPGFFLFALLGSAHLADPKGNPREVLVAAIAFHFLGYMHGRWTECRYRDSE